MCKIWPGDETSVTVTYSCRWSSVTLSPLPFLQVISPLQHPYLLAVLLAILIPLFSRWYHFEISRHVAESVLISTGEDGSYLLHDSASNPGEFTLSVR